MEGRLTLYSANCKLQHPISFVCENSEFSGISVGSKTEVLVLRTDVIYKVKESDIKRSIVG